jgi:hypothetical protein
VTRAMKRSMKVRMGTFASSALAGRPGNGALPAPEDVVRAIRFYLSDRDREVPGWAYPGFAHDRPRVDEIELELDLEEALWRSLKDEASSQGVEVERLLEHAALYYVAELDAGRFAARILDDLGEDLEAKAG